MEIYVYKNKRTKLIMGYIDVLRGSKLRDIKLLVTRRQAWNDQKGCCAKCKEKLTPCYCKYVEDNSAKSKFKVLCSDCFFKMKK